MKTLNNHLILYDAECPMCRAYTQAFTRTGMLDRNGRSAYQDLTEAQCPLVDRRRAVNEIALVNLESGEVTYGIESLFKIIGNSVPFLKPVFSFSPVVRLAGLLYAFVSYNRRVIVPAATRTGLQPDFRWTYRLAYLLFALLITVLLLNMYTPAMAPLLPAAPPVRELLICSGQLVVQTLILTAYAPARTWDYLGNMVTVSLAGSILLLVPLLIGTLFALPAWFFVAAFLVVATLMLFEHMRRCRLLGLGWLPSVTWLAFRLIVLYFVI